MSLRLINKQYKKNFVRNSPVIVNFSPPFAPQSGRITKSNYLGYLYITLDDGTKVSVHPKCVSLKENHQLPTVAQLNLELFNNIQANQGYAHISDGLDSQTHKQFFNIIRISYKHSKIALKKIEIFLKKYGEFQDIEELETID